MYTPLNKKQASNLVYYFFLYRGRFPAGMDPAKWEAITMAQMEFDDPPLPGNPHLEKQKTARELEVQYAQLGISIASPLGILKKAGSTMGELWLACYDSQEELS